MIAASILVTALASPAEAARRKKRHVGGGYAPPYAAMVIDAKTGRVLHAVNEDAPRVPASITKVMTLYLLFEQLERGRFRMDTPLRVSAYAAAQAPSKIGFEPGESIEVEDAIKALVTKSANDVAMAVAENVAGSEDEFARMMTAKARALGMNHSVFHNPHGLPHEPPNLTTARDLTILARAIQERFPRYYPLFATRSFNYAGGTYRNHNKLLGRVEGVDGIKTGYTRASGFNLMTSAKAEGRHIVSVVLGGRSGAARDRIMADLVVANLPRAATGSRTAPMVAEAEPAAPAAPQIRPAGVAQAPAPLPPPPAAVPAPRPRAEIGAQAQAYAATTTPVPGPLPPARVGQTLELSAMRPVAAATTTPPAMRWAIGAPAVGGKILRPPANVDVTSSIARLAEPEEEARAPLRAEAGQSSVAKSAERNAPEPRSAEKTEPRIADAKPAAARIVAAGWMIQLGATDDEAKAKDILARARGKASGLTAASAFTEKVQKGNATLFRARFAGFDDSKDAQSACTALKRSGFSCFATRG